MSIIYQSSMERWYMGLITGQCGVEQEWLYQACTSGLTPTFLQEGMEIFTHGSSTLYEAFTQVMAYSESGDLAKIITTAAARKGRRRI